jgi:hypothetical protein
MLVNNLKTFDMKKAITAIIIPLLLLSFISCTSCKERNAAKKLKENEKEQLPKLEKTLKDKVYPLPTSAEIIKMLTDLEVGYMIGLTNPAANVKKYYMSYTRSINLGVYGADLSYVSLYNNYQEAQTYLDVLRILSNDLNMSKVYDRSLYDSIRKNIDNRDRLVLLLTNTFNDTYNYMADNDQQTLALLVVGGAWVEGMYLTTNVSEAAYNVATIASVLLKQKESFELYLDLTKPYLDDPMIRDFVKELDPIKAVYAPLGTSLTDNNIKDIKTAIFKIRNKIVLQ